MFSLFAHADHSFSEMDTLTAIDHCLPIIVGAGIVITIMFGVIVYFLFAWQPKPKKTAKPPKARLAQK